MENSFEIKSIESDLEIEKCFDVALVLRPHLKKEMWINTIREMVANEKYNLKVIYDQGNIISFVGYRIMTSLHSGHIIYIDDLCTLDAYRGMGLGNQLLLYVRTVAISKKMDAVVLDTGFNNHSAQKLYFKNGFELSAVHLHAYLK